jgi:hypothetical protein
VLAEAGIRTVPDASRTSAGELTEIVLGATPVPAQGTSN